MIYITLSVANDADERFGNYLQRQLKYNEARYRAAKAKNEYVLCLDAADAAIQKYFVDDVSDLIDVSFDIFMLRIFRGNQVVIQSVSMATKQF
jgi:hypothetical protein